MTDALAERFEGSLDGLGVGHTRTAAAGLDAAIEGAVVDPAVAAPLPFDDLSIEAESVTVGPTPDELRSAATGVTAAGAGIAEYGSVVVQSRPGGDEPISLYPERHVAVLRRSDLLEGVPAATEWLAGEIDEGRDSAVIATGASATADMGELVYGVHGPRDVHVIVVTDR